MCTKRRLKLRYAQLILKCYSALTGLVLLDNFCTYCLNPAKAVLKKDHGWVMVKSQIAHETRAYPSFCGMNQLGIFLLPPG